MFRYFSSAAKDNLKHYLMMASQGRIDSLSDDNEAEIDAIVESIIDQAVEIAIRKMTERLKP